MHFPPLAVIGSTFLTGHPEAGTGRTSVFGGTLAAHAEALFTFFWLAAASLLSDGCWVQLFWGLLTSILKWLSTGLHGIQDQKLLLNSTPNSSTPI